MLAVALALASALAWGTADFLAGVAARRIALLSVMLVSQGAGMALLLVLVAIRGGEASGSAIGWGALAGACGAVGLGAFYWAMAHGRISVVSPITACGAVLPLVLAIAGGERPGFVALTGAVLALAGAVLASAGGGAGEPPPGERLGIAAAALSALCLGGFLFTLDRGAGRGDPLTALVAVRGASLLLIALAVLGRRERPHVPAPMLPWVLLAGALDTSANGLFVLASQRGLLSLVSVLASLYPVATVVLAHVALGERLGRRERTGVVAALAGVALVSLR